MRMQKTERHLVQASGLALATALAVFGSVSGVQAKAPGRALSRPETRRAAAMRAVPHVVDGRRVVAVLHLVATAYGPSAQDNYPYGATNYFGRPLTPGTVAVDPAQIPLGTELVVTGYRSTVLPPGGFLGHALDTGDAIGPGRIDVYLAASNAVVQRFGIQHVTAYVLGPAVKPAQGTDQHG